MWTTGRYTRTYTVLHARVFYLCDHRLLTCTPLHTPQSPGGTTPLCHHIREVVKQIRRMEPVLRQRGHKAVVVIASDGEASDGNVANELKQLTVSDGTGVYTCNDTCE